MARAMMGQFRDVMAKYGKVAAGVHVSVSALCLSGCYVAVRSSLDVEAALEHLGLYKGDKDKEVLDIQRRIHSMEGAVESATGVHFNNAERESVQGGSLQREQVATSAEVGMGTAAVKGGSAFAIAFLCNKILFPVRAPLTLALTPPVWRFLKRQGFRV